VRSRAELERRVGGRQLGGAVVPRWISLDLDEGSRDTAGQPIGASTLSAVTRFYRNRTVASQLLCHLQCLALDRVGVGAFALTVPGDVRELAA
jgi:hypothetical protein